MSWANPIDTALVEQVMDDLEDNNHHTLCELLAKAYGIPWGSIPAETTENAYQAAHKVLQAYYAELFSSNTAREALYSYEAGVK
tara:strand:- start:582 stop:833 length:252 start_codon:yes stop_codon:yes gene_type:complete